VLGHLLFIAGAIEQETLADRRALDLWNALDGALQRVHQRLALIRSEGRTRPEQNDVRDHDFFLVFDSHLVRIVFLNFVHFAFFASLYF